MLDLKILGTGPECLQGVYIGFDGIALHKASDTIIRVNVRGDCSALMRDEGTFWKYVGPLGGVSLEEVEKPHVPVNTEHGSITSLSDQCGGVSDICSNVDDCHGCVFVSNRCRSMKQVLPMLGMPQKYAWKRMQDREAKWRSMRRVGHNGIPQNISDGCDRASACTRH